MIKLPSGVVAVFDRMGVGRQIASAFAVVLLLMAALGSVSLCVGLRTGELQ